LPQSKTQVIWPRSDCPPTVALRGAELTGIDRNCPFAEGCKPCRKEKGRAIDATTGSRGEKEIRRLNCIEPTGYRLSGFPDKIPGKLKTPGKSLQ
jgi:hypothetical protein